MKACWNVGRITAYQSMIIIILDDQLSNDHSPDTQNPLKMNTKDEGAGDDQDDDDVGIGGTDDDDGEVSQNIARGVFSKH